MFTVHVGEYSALNYPTLEGGFTVDVDSLESLMEELEGEYAAVGCIREIKRGEFAGGYEVRVYENMEL